MNQLVPLCLLFIFAFHPTNAWWPFSSSSSDPEAPEHPDEKATHLKNSPVPFEMTLAEEKFLQEARRFMGDLSLLDACHQIVINRIKKSCGDINEEDLGKLGVALLNCQSKAEGRQTFDCTEEMTLGECTWSMDASMWNSYHIISNRARSLCYATRQQQFRLKTEYTVNELAKQAGNQLDLMKNLKEDQSKLSDLAVDTVNKVTAGQDNLIRQQRQLRNSYQDVQRSISTSLSTNINALNEEKAMISERNKALRGMTKNITDKLENATGEIQKQGKDRKESHQQILKDLETIRRKAFEVWNKIDDSTSQMATYHTETEHHYEETLENLKKMNTTIFLLLQTLNDMETTVDSRLTWLAEHLGGTGNKLAILSTCLSHVGYFLVAALSILFLSAPLFTRLVLLVVVPVNAWCEVRLDSSLSYASLTILVTATLVGNWIYLCIKKKFMSPLLYLPPTENDLKSICPAQPSTHETPDQSSHSSFSLQGSVSRPLLEETLSSLTAREEYDLGNTKRLLNMSLPAAFSTPSKSPCGSLTKAGAPCRRSAVKGSNSCFVHSQM